ncbi:MAG: SIMPL domain-containing protein [Luteibaculaceae bacterium]
MKKNIINTTVGPLIVCLAILAGVSILSDAYVTKGKNETIYVTGQAKKDFVSDLAVWSGGFSRQNLNLEEASKAIEKDRELVKEFLLEKGIPAEQIIFEALSANRNYDYQFNDKGYRTERFTGYTLMQRVSIELNDIDLVELVSRDITSLISKGIEFYSEQPQYYYTKLNELKIEMIADATEDARVRAETIAKNGNAKLGKLKNANLGVFQIIAQNSSEDFSWGGNFNTSAKNKTAIVNARLQFGIR